MPQEWPNGPIVLGVQWVFSEHLIRMAAALAGALGEHLICAFVDPASYLIEWAPEKQRTALSLEPSINEEAEFPSEQLHQRLEAILGKPALPLLAWRQVFSMLVGLLCTTITGACNGHGSDIRVPRV